MELTLAAARVGAVRTTHHLCRQVARYQSVKLVAGMNWSTHESSFLAQQHIAVGSEWDALDQDDTNALHLAWVNLPPADRARVEHMLRQVHELASEVGAQLLVREADARGHDIADAVGALEGHHARALWVLLNHPLAFHTARQLLAAQSPVGRFWNLTVGFEKQHAHPRRRTGGASPRFGRVWYRAVVPHERRSLC